MVVWLQLKPTCRFVMQLGFCGFAQLTGKVVPTHIVLYKANEIKEHKNFLYPRKHTRIKVRESNKISYFCLLCREI